jgi:hypothetical protein
MIRVKLDHPHRCAVGDEIKKFRHWDVGDPDEKWTGAMILDLTIEVRGRSDGPTDDAELVAYPTYTVYDRSMEDLSDDIRDGVLENIEDWWSE